MDVPSAGREADPRALAKYLVFLTLVLAVYSFYLLSFTLFDGFSTFSNDAASYVLLAAKWSPYFSPTQAELLTWPIVSFPPGFPALLAITGASESLWASHLVVSMCMLASILVFGIYAASQTNRLLAASVTVIVCLLPGVITNSLGILSENLFLLLSLAALVLYSYVRAEPRTSWVWCAGLFVLLAATLLTRTIGIALVFAFVIAGLFDRQLDRRSRSYVLLAATGAAVAWLTLEIGQPEQHELDYASFLLRQVDRAGGGLWGALVYVLETVGRNFMALLNAWSRYISLNDETFWSFALTYILFAIAMIATGLRAARLKIDAVYIAGYLAIILIWPAVPQMLRFLHPIVPFLLLQPITYCCEKGLWPKSAPVRFTAYVLSVLTVGLLVIVQLRMVEMRSEAKRTSPELLHSFEYYYATEDNSNENLARAYAFNTSVIKEFAKLIPEDGRVAAVKHEHFAILADRAAISLSAVVSRDQQLCNLKLFGVDYVYASGLTSQLNRKGPNIVQDYENFTQEVWSLSSSDGDKRAYVLYVDREAIERELADAGTVCDAYGFLP